MSASHMIPHTYVSLLHSLFTLQKFPKGCLSQKSVHVSHVCTLVCWCMMVEGYPNALHGSWDACWYACHCLNRIFNFDRTGPYGFSVQRLSVERRPDISRSGSACVVQLYRRAWRSASGTGYSDAE